ncbi:MAG: hypothetical protein PVI80_22650 [Anaerolineae bacterium]
MKRASLLVIPLLLLALLVVAVTAEIPERAGLPTGVQACLDQYIASSFTPSQTSILAVKRAQRPWNFSQALSDRVLGDTVYFQTDDSLTWTGESGPSPLPFPPKELWCAILAGQDDVNGQRGYSIVFVGLHMDMYNGDWLVHETGENPFTAESEAALSQIGCQMELN